MGTMTKVDVAKLLTMIAAMYPRFEITDFKIELWFDMIADIPFIVAQTALKKVMMESEFPPTVAQLRKAAVEITTPASEIMDAGQAWGEVQRAISKWGWPEPEKAYAMMSPLTMQVVKQLSWQEICMCEESGVIRGQFMKMYNTLQARKDQDKLLPEKFKNQVKLIADNLNVKQIVGGSN